jgi:hypothetical protein
MALSESSFCDAARYDYANKYKKWTSEVRGSGQTQDVGLYGREGRRGHRIICPNVTGPPFFNRFGKTIAPVDNYCMMSFAHTRSALAGNTVVFAQIFGVGPFAILSLAWNQNSTISLILGEWGFFGATVLETSTASYHLADFNHFEWHSDIAVAGTSKLYVNGGSTPIIDYSGNLGTTQWSHGSLGLSAYNNIGEYTAANYDFCDYVLRDGSVEVYIDSILQGGHDQWGDTRVYGLLSEAGDGFYTDWTPLTGSDHGAMVDDLIEDDDTSYNSALGVGLADTYTKEDLPPDVTDVLLIQPVHVSRKEYSGQAEIQARFRTSGVDYDGDETHALSTTYEHVRTCYADIGGNPITPDDVNNGESGPVTV